MQLPIPLLDSLQSVKGFDKEAFEKVHESGEQITSIRINPCKLSVESRESPGEEVIHDSRFTIHEKVPWSQYGYYLKKRPSFTFDPLFHAGCYYVQEASSMFLEQALKQAIDLTQPLKVLDLCAAPGGKSTHILSLISDKSLLVCNDVIRSRANILKENIIKWGCTNAVVTNNDPQDFAKLENYFDVIVVDAPCSGSGLFRRDEEAIEEWSLNNVALCSQRQQRILADVWPSLKRDGILIYSTCSYSKEEDEDILDWVMSTLTIDMCQLSLDAGWGIVKSGGGYRFWPEKIKGEGFFMACFRKTDGDESLPLKRKSKRIGLTKVEKEIVERWVNTVGLQFIKYEDTVYAWLSYLAADFNMLLIQLRIIYSGTIIGELMGDKLIPNHALA
ncbi:MAG: RsmB/NOP family class I SAM-dependent RNA methyltransferase, partial [Bacteroidia bacterium]|nr:RsmB/NOP family class I SAM-dependent RNA methyltransferase [Bacteroidia bacterium]